MKAIDADALKREIVEFAVGISSENQDYYTGYISALSVVQGNWIQEVELSDCPGY